LRLSVEEHVKAVNERGEMPPLPELPKDRIYVYYETDFLNMSNKIQHIIGLIGEFRFVLNRTHLVNKDGDLFQKLSKTPEIAEFLARLFERRKKSQEAQQ